MIKGFSFIITTIIFWHFFGFLTLAESTNIDEMDRFPPGPLEVNIDDPLVRNTVKDKPLTLREKNQLEIALDNLNQEAIITLQNGDQETAFDIWNRELRLRRYLGLLAEVQALSRVGAIAWGERNAEQVKYITQRLQAIEEQMGNEKRNQLKLWRSLGEAYQNVRSPQLAVVAYQQVLNLVKQENNINSELATLQTIGKLQLSWFDYSQAAQTYEKMLTLVKQQGDKANEIAYLQELAKIYNHLQDDQKAINVLTNLSEIYTRDNQLISVPSLKISIADNYKSLAQKNPQFLQSAFKNYQEAYLTAWKLKSYVTAGEALQKLIKLYRDQNQINEALQASQILLETQTLTNDLYGLMETYDQIGEFYLEKQEINKALTAFQTGLKIAQQLKYQEKYFSQKIAKLDQNQSSGETDNK